MKSLHGGMARIGAALVLVALGAGCRGGTGLGNAPSGSETIPTLVAGRRSSAEMTLQAHARERAMPFKVVGSANTVTADMPVPRPDTNPCAVVLFDKLAFKNFNNQTFAYAPPAKCPGPWSKVVLNFNVSTSKGVQFDRTAIMWIDGAVVYFGTTAEPSPQLAPHWHTERDVTDLSALFKGASQGQISLGNCFCPPNYTGILYGRAWLQFYPPDKTYPAPRVPDEVIGMPYSPPLGNAVQLPQSPMQIATALPKNIVGADLDLYLQSQHDEEQWFMCVPTPVYQRSHQELGFCPNSGFREGVVTIDGTPAGLAPVYPWIYTGGLDPYLWAPIPGVQTLAFVPYRVNLTPFAGYLDGASSPTIAVTVANAFDYFTGAGDLLLYLDPKAKRVSGKLVTDTLTAPTMLGQQHIAYGSGTGLFGGPTAAGPTSTRSHSVYRIDGYVDTSSGKVETALDEDVRFVNQQTFDYTAGSYVQILAQDMTMHRRATTIVAGKRTIVDTQLEYPIDVRYPITSTSTGFQLPIEVYQGYDRRVAERGAGTFASELRNTVTSADTMIFDSNFNWTGVKDGASLQLYTFKENPGLCYGREITSSNNVVATDHAMPCLAPSPTPPPPYPGARTR